VTENYILWHIRRVGYPSKEKEREERIRKLPFLRCLSVRIQEKHTYTTELMSMMVTCTTEVSF